MNNLTTGQSEKIDKESQKNKAWGAAEIFVKSFFSLLLLAVAALFVVLHSWVNLSTDTYSFYSYMWFFKLGVVKNISELEKVVTHGVIATAAMNPVEVFIWILIPTLIITLVISIWKRGRFLIYAGLVVFLILFAIAQATNLIGANKMVGREVKIWRLVFKTIEYPGVNSYDLSTVHTGSGEGAGKDELIKFETSDNINLVKKYYESKGFGRFESEYCSSDSLCSAGDFEAAHIQIVLKANNGTKAEVHF